MHRTQHGVEHHASRLIPQRRIPQRRTFFILCSMLTLAACAAGTSNNESNSGPKSEVDKAVMESESKVTNQPVNLKAETNTMAEKISGLSYDGKQVSVTVLSNGCTTKDDFVVEHFVQNEHCYATVIRTKPDYCKVTPTPVQLLISWEQPAECKSENITFTNPLLVTGPNPHSRKLPASGSN